MNAITLIMGMNHPLLRLYPSYNGFGDQILEFVQENIDGSVLCKTVINPETQWCFLSKAELIQLFNNS